MNKKNQFFYFKFSNKLLLFSFFNGFFTMIFAFIFFFIIFLFSDTKFFKSIFFKYFISIFFKLLNKINGLSLNLKGLEHGYNDNALSRRVVVHGAWYVEPSFIRQTGHAGRSWGCPAVAKSIASSLIHTIQGGTLVYAYYPDLMYLHRSSYA